MIGDPLGEREAAQPDQPVRRLGADDRDVAQAGQLDLRLVRRLPDDGQLGPQVGGALGERLGQAVGGKGSQEAVVEMLPELVVAGRGPARAVGVAEPADDPPHVGQGRAVLGVGSAGEQVTGLLKGGPAGQAVLAGDSRLGIVPGAELPRRLAALGLDLEVPQTGMRG